MGKEKPPIIDAEFEVVGEPPALPGPRRRMLLRQKIGWAGVLIGVAIAIIDIATDGRAFSAFDRWVQGWAG